MMLSEGTGIGSLPMEDHILLIALVFSIIYQKKFVNGARASWEAIKNANK